MAVKLSIPEKMDESSDPGKAWMLALQSGDEAAFHQILQHYGRGVQVFFRAMGADRASAEDLMQEVFLRIYRARRRYQPSARFSTWLHRIVKRIAINEGMRNRWRRARPLVGEEDPAAEGGLPVPADERQPSPLRRLEADEVRAQVRTAVLGLPTSQRTALLLHRFQGLSYEEVGEILGLKLPAVKSLLFRARENVRKVLAPLLGEEVTDEPR